MLSRLIANRLATSVVVPTMTTSAPRVVVAAPAMVAVAFRNTRTIFNKKPAAAIDEEEDAFDVFEEDDDWFIQELLGAEEGEQDFVIPEADLGVLQGEKKGTQ